MNQQEIDRLRRAEAELTRLSEENARLRQQVAAVTEWIEKWESPTGARRLLTQTDPWTYAAEELRELMAAALRGERGTDAG